MVAIIGMRLFIFPSKQQWSIICMSGSSGFIFQLDELPVTRESLPCPGAIILTISGHNDDEKNITIFGGYSNLCNV